MSTLRKCPACKNQVDAESEVCPVCGCNPTVHRIKSAMLWGVAAITVAWIALHGHVHWGTMIHAH
jgi:hypothetical protein